MSSDSERLKDYHVACNHGGSFGTPSGIPNQITMHAIVHFILFIPLALALSIPFALVMATPQVQSPTVYLNQAFTLHPFSQITLTDSASGRDERLVLELGTILDSRCPKDVLCIQAGTAEVNLSLSTTSGESATIQVNMGGNKFVKSGPVQANQITLGGKTYIITVLAVAPYPDVTGVQLPKQASFIVARL